MISFLNNRKPLLILIHVLIGTIIAFFPLSSFYTVLIIIIGCVSILATNNRGDLSLMAASYIVGAEVFLRMTSGTILYEIGKYSVIIFLFLGVYFGKNNNRPNVLYVFYILLLLLGIVLTSVPEGESIRKAVAFNLSGPFTLGVCSLILYQKKIESNAVLNILFTMLLPIIALLAYLFFRTPSISEIVFNSAANFDASGGFGPNQVATVLGLGIFIIIVFFVKNKKLTGYRVLDFLLLIYLIYRGLLTFSRGGMLTALLCIIVFLFFYILYSREGAKKITKFAVIFGVIATGIMLYTSNITGGMLINRYSGKNSIGEQKKDITSGREKLIKSQIENFYANPLFGIGVGNGKYEREVGSKTIDIASHNEIGRLLEEHGLVGLLSLLLLIGVPIIIFIRSNNYQRGFIIAFYFFWFLTINHSAMRIAFPSFIYGLCLINIVDDDE